MFPLLHRIQRTLIIRHIRISCRVSFFNFFYETNVPPPNHVGRPTWGLEVGEGDLRSRRRSNVQVANVGVERPTFPP